MPTFGEEDWLRLKDVFEAARALPAESRPAYLARACHDNPAQRLEVEELLASHERTGTFLERPVMLLDGSIGTSIVPSVPARIGRYRITDTLGEGGMGVVYAAIDEQLERPIAVKVLRQESAADPAARERFSREARLAASVNHPHICQLYEIGESDGRLFMAMERLEGEPLAARLSRGAMPIAETVQIGLEGTRRARCAAPARHHAPRPQTVQRFFDTSRSESARLWRLNGPDGRRDASTAH